MSNPFHRAVDSDLSNFDSFMEENNISTTRIDVPKDTNSDKTETPSIVIEENEKTEEAPKKAAKEEIVDVRPSQKVTIKYPFSSKTDWNENEDTLSLPSDYSDVVKKKLDNLPNINLTSTRETREWAEIISEGNDFTMVDNVNLNTLERESGDFKQTLDHNGKSIISMEPKFSSSENQKLAGEKGLIRMMSALGLGTLFNTALYHSGIWITFKAPSEASIVELNRNIVADKIRFGRFSYGLAFSNLSSFMIEKVVNFALDHVYDISIKTEDLTNVDIKDIILCQDIPSLLWGFINTMYPKGFQYNRACINNPLKCQHIVREKLNLNKLQITDNNGLTDWQKTHISVRRANSKSLVDVKRYQEENKKLQETKIELMSKNGSDISFILKTPTINQYIDSGHRWIDNIVDMVDKILGKDANENERNNLIMTYGQASAMRQYSHWVSSIEIGTNVIEDHDTLEESISMLSIDDDLRELFTKAVVKYIDDSTVSVIAIPVFECPVCGEINKSDNNLERHQNQIPLDMIQTFFSLARNRLAKITNR